MKKDPYFSAFSPAFPITGSTINELKGLTKREYFAAVALQGLVTLYDTEPERAAQLAVKAADALVNEFEKMEL